MITVQFCQNCDWGTHEIIGPFPSKESARRWLEEHGWRKAENSRTAEGQWHQFGGPEVRVATIVTDLTITSPEGSSSLLSGEGWERILQG